MSPRLKPYNMYKETPSSKDSCWSDRRVGGSKPAPSTIGRAQGQPGYLLGSSAVVYLYVPTPREEGRCPSRHRTSANTFSDHFYLCQPLASST